MQIYHYHLHHNYVMQFECPHDLWITSTSLNSLLGNWLWNNQTSFVCAEVESTAYIERQTFKGRKSIYLCWSSHISLTHGVPAIRTNGMQTNRSSYSVLCVELHVPKALRDKPRAEQFDNFYAYRFWMVNPAQRHVCHELKISSYSTYE